MSANGRWDLIWRLNVCDRSIVFLVINDCNHGQNYEGPCIIATVMCHHVKCLLIVWDFIKISFFFSTRFGRTKYKISRQSERGEEERIFPRGRTDERQRERHVTKLTFKHRASCILGQAFHYSPENAFYIFNQHIYFII